VTSNQLKLAFARPFLILILAGHLGYEACAQEEDLPGNKAWYLIGVSAKTSKKTSVTFYQLYSFRTDLGHAFQFVQSSISGSLRPKYLFEWKYGYAGSLFLRSQQVKATRVYDSHKMFTEIVFRNKFKILRFKNSLKFEWHTPQQLKYRFRVIYSLRIGIKPKFLPLRGEIYIRNQIYYYIAGKPSIYYTTNGEFAAFNSPSDFHRYRLTFGYRFKPVNRLSMNLFYIYQSEFNTPFTSNRDLNVRLPSSSEIRYPFNNYHVIGVSMFYQIKRTDNKPFEK